MRTRLKYHLFLTLGLLLFSTLAIAQSELDTCLIRGFVYDAETDEPVPFTNVVAKELMVYAVTDYDGYYELRIPRKHLKDGDEITVVAQTLGWQRITTSIGFRNGTIAKHIYLKQHGGSYSDPGPPREEKVELPKMDLIPPTQIAPILYGDDGGHYLQVLPGRVQNTQPRVTIAGWSGPGSCLRIDVTYEDY